MDSRELLETAKEAALIAGKIIQEGFGTAFEIDNKEGKNNLVTEYDKKAENAIIDFISEKYPGHSFLAEESGQHGHYEAGKVHWVIDPLDGTVNFANSLPIYSVSIAAELNGEILAATIYNPTLDELFTAEKGKGAYKNGKKISVSQLDDLDKGFVVTGFPYNVADNPCSCIDHFVSMIRRGVPVRRLGSAALDLAYVAAGIFDTFWEIDLKPWDVAAGVLLIREAGGVVTQFDGSDYRIHDRTILATNGKVHEEVKQILSTCCAVDKFIT